MTLADTALANPAVKALAHEYLHGTLDYITTCDAITAHGYTELEAGLIMAEALIQSRS